MRVEGVRSKETMRWDFRVERGTCDGREVREEADGNDRVVGNYRSGRKAWARRRG